MQRDNTLIQKSPGSFVKKYPEESIISDPAQQKAIKSISCLNKNIELKKKEFTIDNELAKLLQIISSNEGTTVFMTLLGVLHVLFYRYNTQDDICIGIPYSFEEIGKQQSQEVLFNGLNAMRTRISSETPFKELLRGIKATSSEAAEQKKLAAHTSEDVAIQNNNSKINLTRQVMLTVKSSTLQFGILQLSGGPLEVSSSNPEISFSIAQNSQGLAGAIQYDSALYEDDRIDRMAKHFEELISSITKEPNEKISKLNILPAGEIHQLLETFNDTEVAYPRDKSIVNLFEEQVTKTPAKIAVVFENERLTYEALNKRSNQLARYLKSLGVKKEALIPICLERSVEMLIGIIGILKAGAAYVPIDPEYPEDRINYMLEDTAAKVVITSKSARIKLPTAAGIDIIELDGHKDAIAEMPLQNPESEINSRNLAYVIYTSGSTGKPKGVMIEHQAVVDHCFGLIKVAKLEDCASFALFSPLVFDAGHSIIFTSIFLGASLNVLSKRLIMDGEKLVAYLEKYPVDCIKIVPSVWLSYVNGENTVLANKVMIFGGETFSAKIQEHLVRLDYKGIVYNHYGPTEATIGKCIHTVDLKRAYKTVPIGKPFSNTQLYVVDEWDQIVPIGIAGELYIAGEGIAREYLNRPDLSAEKFILNPFRADVAINNYDASDPKPVSRLYKTGDKVRWNTDGEIEYLGRIDEQVKMSGYRIELGEIENVLLQNKNIRQAAVRLNEDNQGNKMLVGYVVPTATFDKQNTITQLQEKLPEYMIPGMWVELERLPQTPNGKIDKKALPIPDFSKLMDDQYAAPTNDTEIALVKIWEHLLGVKKVGIHDTFFELGGNSIQTVTMFTRIRKQFGKELPLATIFQAPNISKLAAIINQKDKVVNVSCLVPIQPQGAKPPLFCMHAGAGNVLFYKDLSKNLGMQQPLYGLMARGLNGKEHFHTSIEEMAAHYIKEIRSVQPHGPYFLAGYCLGGTLAFEMAQQLLKEGEKTELLATFNSRSSTYLNAPSIDSNNSSQKRPPRVSSIIRAYAGDYSSLKSKEKVLYPLKVMKVGSKVIAHVLYNKTRNKILRLNARAVKFGFDYYLSKGKLLPRFLRNKYMLHTNGIMSRAYKTGIYPGKMLVFRSPQIYKDPYLGWKQHVSGVIESYDVSGKYRRRSEIMNEPYINVIASKLKTLLESSKQKPTDGTKINTSILS
ncbi:MAG: amino acid adenylation domain-containing protein [Ginsengibacter sp.]